METYSLVFDAWIKTRDEKYDRMLDILANEDLFNY